MSPDDEAAGFSTGEEFVPGIGEFVPGAGGDDPGGPGYLPGGADGDLPDDLPDDWAGDDWAGGEVREVVAAYSSCTCSECWHVDPASRVSQALFVCTKCGHREHADVNAAKVILNRGTHGGAGCGGFAVVKRPKKQQLRVVRRGNRHDGQGSSKAPAFRPV